MWCWFIRSSEARPLVTTTIKLGVQELHWESSRSLLPETPIQASGQSDGAIPTPWEDEHPHTPPPCPGSPASRSSPRVKRAPPRVICRLFVIPLRPPARQACRARQRWCPGFKLAGPPDSLGETGPMEPPAAPVPGCPVLAAAGPSVSKQTGRREDCEQVTGPLLGRCSHPQLARNRHHLDFTSENGDSVSSPASRENSETRTTMAPAEKLDPQHSPSIVPLFFSNVGTKNRSHDACWLAGLGQSG